MTLNSKPTAVLGYFGKGNSGDEAFKDAHRLLLDDRPLNFWSSLTSSEYKEKDHSSIAILGGGDVVAPFFLNKIPTNKRFIMYSVGLKYEQSSIQAIKSRGADLVYTFFRNRIDCSLCEEAGIHNCTYMPDMVFALAKSYQEHRLPPNISHVKSKGKYVIVCLADHFNYSSANTSISHSSRYEHRKYELAKALDSIANDYRIVFLPLSTYKNHMDHRFHYEVYRAMKNKKYCDFTLELLTPLQAIKFVSTADAIISMKLHGNIYGLVASCPTVNIGIGRKQRLLFEEAGLSNQFVSDIIFDSDSVINCLATSLSRESKSRAEILKDTYYKQVLDSAAKLKELLL